MALTLVATAGDASANTYISLADAETYFESRLYATDWSGATTGNKNIALVYATRLIDQQMAFIGVKAEDTQALQWPRTGAIDRNGYPIDYTTIPDEITYATAEFALFLLGEDRASDPAGQGIKQIQVDVISIKFDATTVKPVMPQAVWNILKFYGVKASSVHRTLKRA